jgi:hypothetical protein
VNAASDSFRHVVRPKEVRTIGGKVVWTKLAEKIKSGTKEKKEADEVDGQGGGQNEDVELNNDVGDDNQARGLERGHRRMMVHDPKWPSEEEVCDCCRSGHMPYRFFFISFFFRG